MKREYDAAKEAQGLLELHAKLEETSPGAIN